MRRSTLPLAVTVAAALLAPTASAAPIPAGGLNGFGCMSRPADAALVGCTAGHTSLEGLLDIELSPDGKQLYALGQDAEHGAPGRIVTFARDGATGALTFDTCRGPGVTGCTGDARLNQPFASDLAPGGEDLYVADATLGIVHYRRAADGALTFQSCAAPVATAGCTTTFGIGNANGLAVSPDGESVYVASYTDDAATVFSRDETSGELTFVECMTSAAAPGCAMLPTAALGSVTDVAVTGDSAHVYFSSRGDGGVTGFDRNASTGALSDPQPLVGDYLEGAQTVAVAPRDNVLYVGLFDGAGLSTLALEPGTGTPSLLSCLRTDATPPCQGSPGVDTVFGLGFSPDGDILYAASRNGGSVASFRRGEDGALSLVGCANAPAPFGTDCGHRVNGLYGAQSVAASADGRFVYSAGESAIATLKPEHRPVCAPLAGTVENGHPIDLQISCTDADGQPLKHAIAAKPAYGSAAVLDATAGRLRYRPRLTYRGGLDSFTVTASDGTNVSPSAQVRITVERDVRPPRMKIFTKRARLSARGRIRIELRCLPGEPGGCKGRLAVSSATKLTKAATAAKSRKRVKLGSHRFSIAVGKRKAVTIVVPKGARRLIDAKGHLGAFATATATDASGNKGRAKRKVAVLSR